MSFIFSRLLLIASLILACCIYLPGMATFAVDSGKPDKYVFVLAYLGNPYWQAVKQGIEDTSRKLKLNAIVMSPISDSAREEVLNLCQAAISQKPKLIAMVTTINTIGIQCFREINKQGIKVGDIDATISINEAKEKGIPLSFTVGADNISIGKIAAQYVATHTKFPKPKILVLEGMVGSVPSADRVKGLKEQIKKSIPQAKIVSSISGDWDRLRALNITADTLTRVPDLNVVFAANDMMALGAVEAVRAAGKTGHIMIIGVDGVPDARTAIKAGHMDASIMQFPYLVGKRSAELAAQAVQGQVTGVTERTPLLILTKQVLEANKDPLLQYVR